SVFDNNLFSDYWYQSEEIPSFLAELIKPGLADLRVFRNEKFIVPSHNTIVLGEQLKPIPVLFQSGYLTAAGVKKSLGADKFFLKIPNLELRAVLIPLLLSLEPIKEPWEAWQKASHMVSSLIKLEADGFENAFRSFLTEFPDSSQTPGDAHYQSLFQMAMLLAEAKLEMEISVANRETRCGRQMGPNSSLKSNTALTAPWRIKKRLLAPKKTGGRRCQPWPKRSSSS
ncbi:MAG: hypothetical protein LBT47_13240, partial [Deltaproteobacteria bacterium]|nr:hypothetical protein [Deltaproteobacteria bacterium]